MLVFCSSMYLLISWKEPGLAGGLAGPLHCRQIVYCLSHQGSPVIWMSLNVRSSCLRKMERLVLWQSWSHISTGWHAAIMSHCDHSSGHYCDQHHHWHYCPRLVTIMVMTKIASTCTHLSPPSRLFSTGCSPFMVLTQPGCSREAAGSGQWWSPRAPSALSVTLFQDGGAVQGIWKS